MGINIKKDGTILLPPFDENSDWDTNMKINISNLHNLNSYKDIISSFSSGIPSTKVPFASSNV
jgi:hypothetical protein